MHHLRKGIEDMSEMGMAATEPARGRATIEVLFDATAEMLSAVETSVANLRSELKPVTKDNVPEPTTMDNQKRDFPVGTSPVSSMLNEFCHRLSNLELQLDTMRHRLEI